MPPDGRLSAHAWVGRAPAGAAAVVLAAVAAVAACTPGATGPAAPTSGGSSATGAPASPGPLPRSVTDGFTVEIAQARTDRVARVVELRVHNGSAADLTVLEGRLTSATTSGPAVTEEPREVGAGRTRALRAALAAPVCPPGGVTTAVDPAPVVELDVVDADGRRATVRVAPTDETDDLRRVHGEDCAAAAVAAGLELGLEETLTTRDDGTAEVVLRVRPVPGGPHVRLVQVGGTTLLRPASGYGPWVLDVDSAAPPPDGRVVLPVAPARCDLHAIAEDKRGTVLPVHAAVDGVALPPVFVAAPPALRGALHDFVLDACGSADHARS